MSFFGGSSTTAPAASDPKDLEVTDPPTESISSLSFSPVADFLAVGSWDNNVRIYEVSPAGQTRGTAMYAHQAPVLSTCWSKDGTKIVSGGCDNAVRVFDVQTGQSSQIGQHDGPVKVVRAIETPQGSIVASGSWDKTLKYWDMRSPAPISSVALPERCYTLDVVYPLLVVGTAERHIQIFNLSNPTQPFKTLMSPLKWQTRVLSCFPGANGFAIGSVEGRVAIQYVEDKDNANNFSFKCHRKDAQPNGKDQSLVFAVNDITFHPQQGTFSTCGSDGTINFWDKDARTRLKSFEPCPGPVTTTTFNHTGTIFAYSVAYDWSKGHSGMTAGHVNKIMLHPVKDDEVKKRPSRK